MIYSALSMQLLGTDLAGLKLLVTKGEVGMFTKLRHLNKPGEESYANGEELYVNVFVFAC